MPVRGLTSQVPSQQYGEFFIESQVVNVLDHRRDPSTETGP